MNPGFSAPEADALIRARLRALDRAALRNTTRGDKKLSFFGRLNRVSVFVSLNYALVAFVDAVMAVCSKLYVIFFLSILLTKTASAVTHPTTRVAATISARILTWASK